MFKRKEVSENEITIEVQKITPQEFSDHFQQEANEVLNTGYALVTLDLQAVKHLSTAGIGKIIMMHRKMNEQKRTLRIKGCSNALFEVFKLLQLNNLMPIEKQDKL